MSACEGRAEIARHLHCQRAPCGDIPAKSRKQGRMIVQPMQRRVGKDEVEFRRRVPARDIALFPSYVRLGFSRFGQHLRRAIDAGDAGIGPATAQYPRDVAGAATQVDHGPRMFDWNTRDQIQRRTQALSGETRVLLRIPAHVPFLLRRRARRNGVATASAAAHIVSRLKRSGSRIISECTGAFAWLVWISRAALDAVSFAYAEAGKDFPEQVVGGEFAGDAVELLLRQAQLLGE